MRAAAPSTRRPRCWRSIPDLVPHVYPITPYHADYIHHVDRVPEPVAAATASLQVRAGDGVTPLLADKIQLAAAAWDVSIDEISVGDVVRGASVVLPAWPTAPWVKEGWFQAYHLLRPALGAEEGKRADQAYRLLVDGEAGALAERLNRERELTAALTARLRACRRRLSAAARDLQRRILQQRGKYLFRLAVRAELAGGDAHHEAQGFSVERLAAARHRGPPGGGLESGRGLHRCAGPPDLVGGRRRGVPADPLQQPVGQQPRRGVRARDCAAQETVDPHSRRRAGGGGGHRAADAGRQPARPRWRRSAIVSRPRRSTTARRWRPPISSIPMRWRIAGAVRAWRARCSTPRSRPRRGRCGGNSRACGWSGSNTPSCRSPISCSSMTGRSSKSFSTRSRPTSRSNALIAPPWSSVPWHVLALMDAAVERGIAAFSRTEAERRKLPWLDLVRDPAQRDKLRALIKEFAADRLPAGGAAKAWSTPDAAKARWQALDAFVETSGHLLVTNGPYKLKSFTPEVDHARRDPRVHLPDRHRHLRFPRLSGQGADHAGRAHRQPRPDHRRRRDRRSRSSATAASSSRRSSATRCGERCRSGR